MHLRCILQAAARKTLPFFISPLHHLRFPCQNLSLTQRRSHNRPPCAYPSPRRSPPSPPSHPLDLPIIFSSPSDFWLVCIFFWFLRLLHPFWLRFKERNREKKKEKMGSLGAILKHPEDLFPLLKVKITVIHAEKQIPFEPHWSFCYTLLYKVSLAASLSSSSNFARSSETQCAFSIWFSEALILLALHDGNSVYFLLQVGGDYAYAKGVNTKCPSVAIMLQIGENASYHNMGGCKETKDTCNNKSCRGHEVDIMHFSIGNAIPGRLYGGNPIDNRDGYGGDRFGHLVDVYSWNPHCRYLDGMGPSEL